MEKHFRIKYGFFVFLIMNFGFYGTPSTFKNYINDILLEYLDIVCSAYIDEIFIYSKTKTKYSKHIRLVFQKSQKNRVTTGYRQMRILRSGNRIFNHTRKH